MSEHLKYAMDSHLVIHLSVLLSLCLIGGSVPDGFCQNVITPVLKGSNLDPTLSNNYRPITVSSSISKLLELYIIDECHNHSFSQCQYGFIGDRGTAMASVMAHDVSQECVSKGSTVYMCSLDVQGAFDEIPHSVLLHKTMGIIPDLPWRVLRYWYGNMVARIKWNKMVGRSFCIGRGTKQGGLSSPMIFNIVYQDLVVTLNSMNCGISIEKENYNVFAC